MNKGETYQAIQANTQITTERYAFGVISYFVYWLIGSLAKTDFIILADVNISIFPMFEQ